MSDMSRVEQLLRNALGEDIYEVTPQSRVEVLLQQLNELIEGMGTSVDPTVIESIVTDWLAENIHDGSAAVVDSSLTIAGAAADAKKTGDELSSVKEDLTHKANTDGYYADLVSGGSTQLLSDMVETDTMPYNYRTAGGSLEIGDREKLKKIVGGTVAWNQLAWEFKGSYWGVADSVSYSSGVATIHKDLSTGGSTNMNLLENRRAPVRAGHKYLFVVTAQTTNGLINIIPDGTSSHGSLGFNSYQSKTTINYVWNCSTDDTLYFMLRGYTGAGVASAIDFTVEKPQCFDLTAMFGTTIADYVYGLETATAGAGVAWLKAHFPRIFNAGYIPYNAGELVSVQASAHKMTGFNQWDEKWELGTINASSGLAGADNTRIRAKNYNQCLPNTVYYVKDPTSNNNIGMRFYDADKNYLGYGASQWIGDTTFTTPASCAYFKFVMAASYGTTYKNDICINISSSRNGEYEPYEEHSYSLDSDVTLRGIPKLDANNSLYYDGDEYEADGTVTRKYGTYTFTGEETGWEYIASNWAIPGFRLSGSSWNRYMPDAKAGKMQFVTDTKYTNVGSYGGWDAIPVQGNLVVGSLTGAQTGVVIRDDAYTSASTFASSLAGKTIVYELATPTTESADPYTEIQNVSSWGTEEFVSTGIVPVGHETRYPENLRAKIEGLPWNFASLIAPTESAFVATRNYTTGALLIVNNVLYKATANIANGGTITVGTNVTATTLAEVIAALS